MASEVISFIILSAALVAAGSIMAGYIISTSSATTARLADIAARQVLMTSESITIVAEYSCNGGNSVCIDVMNNSGRGIGMAYVYDQGGNRVNYVLLDSTGQPAQKLPLGTGTVRIDSPSVTSGTIISENWVVYRVA